MAKKRYKKKGQEEIVGFALIIIIVAVVLLFLLSFSLKSPQKESVESYEVDSFIQSALQYTTNCQVSSKNQSVQSLILDCSNAGFCSVGTVEVDSCEVLNSTLAEISKKSWPVESGISPVKGYELKVTEGSVDLISISGGNATSNYKGGLQNLPELIKVSFKAYY